MIEVPLESSTELLAILGEGVVGFDRIHAVGREEEEREYGRAPSGTRRRPPSRRKPSSSRRTGRRG